MPGERRSVACSDASQRVTGTARTTVAGIERVDSLGSLEVAAGVGFAVDVAVAGSGPDRESRVWGSG